MKVRNEEAFFVKIERADIAFLVAQEQKVHVLSRKSYDSYWMIGCTRTWREPFCTRDSKQLLQQSRDNGRR